MMHFAFVTVRGTPRYQDAFSRRLLTLRDHDSHTAILWEVESDDRPHTNWYRYDTRTGMVQTVEVQGQPDNMDDVTFWARVFVGTQPYADMVSATRDAIRFALCSSSRDSREVAVRHELATPDHLAIAAADASAEIRRLAATHLACPEKLRDCLLSDPSEFVRRAVVSRDDVAPEQCARGLRDKDAVTRMVAAEKCRSVDGLVTVLLDPVWYVREAAILNPLLPVQMCQIMLADSDGAVVAAARKRIKEFNQ